MEKIGRVWLIDRGMVSEENIAFLRERGGHSYIVGTPKAMLRRFEGKMVDSAGWDQVREGIEVKYVLPDAEEEILSSSGEVPSPKNHWKPHPGELFLLRRSADRGLKEESMRKRFEKHYLDGLEKLKKAAQSGRLNWKTLEGVDDPGGIGKRAQNHNRRVGPNQIRGCLHKGNRSRRLDPGTDGSLCGPTLAGTEGVIEPVGAQSSQSSPPF